MNTLKTAYWRWLGRVGASSLRTRLLAVVAAGLTCLALVAALTSAWLTSRRLGSEIESQSLRLVESLAQQSVLGLLYESPDNLAGALDSAAAMPDVLSVVVLTREGRLLAARGQDSRNLVAALARPVPERPRLLRETADDWVFAAPVMSGGRVGSGDAQELQLPAGGKPELLGMVLLHLGKGALNDVRRQVLFNNVAVAVVVSLVFLGLLNLGIRRTTAPLLTLSRLMRRAGEEGRYSEVAVTGPRELRRIARAFNRMMQALAERDRRLNEHKEALESEVRLRTLELVQARDEALSVSRHKSEFLANMSHELRTPLQAIIGYSDIVRERLHFECMDEEAADMDRVVGNAQHLLSLINNVLDLAKVEAGRMDITTLPVDLLALVREAAEMIRPLAVKSGNRLEVRVPPMARLEVLTDRQKLLQILLNLLSNAAKFTQKGEIVLNLEVHEPKLRLVVSDTGIGIPGSELEHIFEEFRQVDGSATRAFQGTGLGLAISRRFVELLGGRITVESTVGRGSSFTVELPHIGPIPDNILPSLEPAHE